MAVNPGAAASDPWPPFPTMNIVAEHFWQYLQQHPHLSNPRVPVPPQSDQCIMLNTMAELCIGGELWCESMEADFGLGDNEAGGGSGGGGGGGGTSGNSKRSGRSGKASKGRMGRSRMNRGGMMRSGVMRNGVMGRGMWGQTRRLRRIEEEMEGCQERKFVVTQERRPGNIECFAEIVSIQII